MNEENPTPESEMNPPADLSADDDTLVVPEAEAVELPVEPMLDDSASEAAASEDVTPVEAETVEPAAFAAVYDESVPVVDEVVPLSSTPPEQDWQVGDIDAALAAVASLSEIMPEREAEAEALADARRSAPSFVPEMPMPPLTTLKRGQLGSIVPALLLIGFGAWLTLTTTSGAAPDPQLVALVVVAGIVLTLLAQWLGTGRWSRGVLFFALMVILFGGVIAFSLQPRGIDLQRGYPLLIVAAGLALVLAGFLARPVNARLIAPGVLVIVAGVVGLAVTLNALSVNLLNVAASLAPVVLVIALIIFLLPLVFRRRSKKTSAEY